MTYHALMYLACEQMVAGVRQLQKKNWARQPTNEMRTRARQLMDILCTGVRQLQLGVRKLLLEELCVGVKQLQLGDMKGS